MERLTNYILTIAGLLSGITCLLLIESSAREAGFKRGIEYCQTMPEVCFGDNSLGDRFGA